MTIEQRIKEAEQKFSDMEKKKSGATRVAEECLSEMTKLQGEWRVLQDLLQEGNSAKASDDKPKVKVKGE